jgi:hypothetical protein
VRKETRSEDSEGQDYMASSNKAELFPAELLGMRKDKETTPTN